MIYPLDTVTDIPALFAGKQHFALNSSTNWDALVEETAEQADLLAFLRTKYQAHHLKISGRRQNPERAITAWSAPEGSHLFNPDLSVVNFVTPALWQKREDVKNIQHLINSHLGNNADTSPAFVIISQNLRLLHNIFQAIDQTALELNFHQSNPGDRVQPFHLERSTYGIALLLDTHDFKDAVSNQSYPRQAIDKVIDYTNRKLISAQIPPIPDELFRL
jgi:hypothetical protein